MDFDACVDCGESAQNEFGVIDIDINGLCDCCREKKEMGNILAADHIREMDFDYSMN